MGNKRLRNILGNTYCQGCSVPSLRRGYKGRIHRTQPVVSLIFFSRSLLHPKRAIPTAHPLLRACNRSCVGNQSALHRRCARARIDSLPGSAEGSRDHASTVAAAVSVVRLADKNKTAKQEAAPHGSTPPGQAPMRRRWTSGTVPGVGTRTARVNSIHLDENVIF